MKHQAEALLNKEIIFDMDFKINETVTIPKGTKGFVTADIDNIFAINFYDVVEGIEYGWVTFKDMQQMRDLVSIIVE
jgi:hypothetical protein